MFRRDASGPMDVDEAHPLGTAAKYAIDDDGPARKRPHSDLSSNNPFLVPSSGPAYKFGPSTPFLFHAPPLPPAPKFEPYDPNRWARTDFGFGSSASALPADTEVDMDAPEANTTASPGSPAIETPTPMKPARRAKAQRKPQPQAAAVVEAEDEEEERPIATGAVARVRRRRKQWNQRNDQEHTYNLHMAAPAVRHSEIPAILLGYVQFVFNASLVIAFLYIATQFILAVRRDVQERIEEYSVEILHEIAGCTQAYLTNRCEPSLRVPAMEAACSAWETCMNRDPKVVGRARVGAETFAGVINSFVDPISWKTMGFTLVTLTFLIILTNSALFNLRAKHQAPAPPQHQNHQQLFPPYMVPGMGQMGQMGQLGYGMHPGMGENGNGNANANANGHGEKTGGVAKALGWLKK